MSILKESTEAKQQETVEQKTINTSEADQIMQEQKRFDEAIRDIEKQTRSFQGSPKEQKLFYDKNVYMSLTHKEVSGLREKINDAIYMNTGRNIYREQTIKYLKTADKNILKAERELDKAIEEFEGEVKFSPTRTIDDFLEIKGSIPDESKGNLYKALEAKKEAKIYERKIQDTEMALLQYSTKEEELDNQIKELRSTSTTPGNLALISELEDAREDILQKQEEAISKIEEYSINKEFKETEYKISDTKFLKKKKKLNHARRNLMEEKSKRRFLDIYIKTDDIIEFGNVVQDIETVKESLSGYKTVLQYEHARNNRIYQGPRNTTRKSFSNSITAEHDKAKVEDSKQRVGIIKQVKEKYMR